MFSGILMLITPFPHLRPGEAAHYGNIVRDVSSWETKFSMLGGAVCDAVVTFGTNSLVGDIFHGLAERGGLERSERSQTDIDFRVPQPKLLGLSHACPSS